MDELTSVDPNWEPPVCWYEPVFTPTGLKAAVENLEREGGLGAVNAHEWWSAGLFVDHYDKAEEQDNFDLDSPANSTAPGYRNYNLGKQGMFWRSVVRKGHEDDIRAWDCGRIMFWQDAGTIPDDEHAPTPETLAAYAYDKIEVPRTEIELKPVARSTVNLPTWVWLDKATFKDVTVRAELPTPACGPRPPPSPSRCTSTRARRTRRPTPPPATARSTRTAPSARRTPAAARRRPRRAGSATCVPRAENRTA